MAILCRNENQPGQSANAPKSRTQGSRLREDSKNPAEIKPISPHGNADLVAGDEAGGGADAINAGAITAVLFDVIADLVLHAAADGDDDMFRMACTDDFEQFRSSMEGRALRAAL